MTAVFMRMRMPCMVVLVSLSTVCATASGRSVPGAIKTFRRGLALLLTMLSHAVAPPH